MTTAKISRNDPCPCGSGKKYKQCCLERDKSAVSGQPAAAAAVAESFQAAMEHFQAGRLGEAEMVCRQILRVEPGQPDVLHMLGVIASQAGKYDTAVELFGDVLKMAPDFAQAHYNMANALKEMGKLDEAITSYRKAISRKPDYAKAYHNLADVLQTQGKLAEAAASYRAALRIDPGLADTQYSLGTALYEQGKLDEAVASYRKAIALKPGYAEAYNNLGTALKEQGLWQEAAESFEQATRCNPGHALAHFNRGIVLHQLKQYRTALESYDKAVALRPDDAVAYYNRGATLLCLDENLAALDSYDRAVALKPDYAEAYSNRGVVLQDLWRLDEALESLDRAIALKPDHAAAYWNKALLKILTGDFAAGWRLYEWRWKDCQKDQARDFAQPLWLGEQPVSGKTLLIHAEQGLGDVVQFCRYAPMAAALGARVVLEVHAPLVALLATLEGGCTIVEKGQPLPPFDLHCPVMSLPLAFKTTLANIPATVPYLHADAGKQLAWRRRLGDAAQPRVGLVWSGSATHKNDRNRSIPLQQLEPLLGLPLEFHALQSEVRRHDETALAAFGQIHLHQDELGDFSETAALLQQMDLVITVDTAVAHLAGAMGKPVWILLPFAPDYRWMLDRNDSPWYPSATLFRQPAAGDWPAVITNVGRELRSRYALQETGGHNMTMEKRQQHQEKPAPQEIDALVALFGQGRLVEAADRARAMTAGYPQYGFGWKALGAVYKQMGRSEDALAPMQKAALLTPGDVEVHYNLGVGMQDMGRLEEAEASYRQALKIDPAYADAHNNLGAVLHGLGRLEEAAASFRRALQIDPVCTGAQANLDALQHEMAQRTASAAMQQVPPAASANPYQLVDARHGRFLVSPHDVYLGRAVILYGEYGEIEWKFLEQLMQDGKDAVEVGANIGTHTVSMARKLAGMGRRLLAVEPQPVVFQNMCANLALNGLFNVVSENAACGDAPGWLTFEAPDYSRENNSGGVSMREDGSGSQRVRSVPLDDLVPGNFDVGLIKIDVEGFEQKVLEGATKTIARCRPAIYLENDRVEQSKALIEWLWAAGYKLWWHIPPLFNPGNFAGKSENIYGNVASFNMLALPTETAITVQGLTPVEDSGAHPLQH
ncbi:photosystem I assembly protein Ycf3 [Sideroxyarcus emersonii]|uniref:Photosystem I assembly protein Ycf3 n=1 Tax=Sideroxyarcus emersonii TaxID=2764705 RepID=A0AAN1X7L3_9PROT|nr:FkbM family methyltransferase [Sideroxyarcus emersonii]BCK86457.1 photosystem I assembly protein Ycf3 [Sideroxyarcus emersonii]